MEREIVRIVLTVIFLFPFFLFSSERTIHEQMSDLERLQLAVDMEDIRGLIKLANSVDLNVVRDRISKDTILHYALSDTRANLAGIRLILRILLRAGADVNARNKFGVTPLHKAMSFASPVVVGDLLEAGADVNATEDADKRTALHIALVFGRNLELIEVLLEFGADMNARDRFGEVPLHKFAKNHSSDVAVAKRLLAVKNVEIDSRDNEDRTPLIYAIKRSRGIEPIREFLRAGASVKAKDRDGRDVYTLISESDRLTTKEKMSLLTLVIENRSQCFGTG